MQFNSLHDFCCTCATPHQHFQTWLRNEPQALDAERKLLAALQREAEATTARLEAERAERAALEERLAASGLKLQVGPAGGLPFEMHRCRSSTWHCHFRVHHSPSLHLRASFNAHGTACAYISNPISRVPLSSDPAGL